MSAADRRRACTNLALGGLGLLVGGGLSGLARAQASAPSSGPPPREIDLVAQRFHYTPSEIHIRAGEAVVLRIQSLDFVHGINLPDHGVRADLVPGRINRVALPARPAGVYAFVCDNFCGDGHEEMHGRIVVSA